MIQQQRRFDPVNVAVAAFVWLAAFVVYYLTKAPTISFWDCGEFIAAGYTLGIPHPPGSPLYVIGARLFSILPISSDPAVRINLLSVFCSATAALFLYLSGRRILALWYKGHTDGISRLLTYAGAAAGAFFAAFSLTNWNNSVEAEVYGMSMMIMAAIFWLAVLAFEKRDSLESQRLMLLVFFLSFLGIGVHMATFLVVPVVVLYFVIKRDAPTWVWYLMAVFIGFELYLIFAMSSRPGEIPFYLPIFIVLLVYLFYIFSFEAIARLHLFVAAALVVSALPIVIPAGRAILPGSNFGAAVEGALDVLSIIVFSALVLFAIYAIYKHGRREHRGEMSGDYLIAASFVGMAALMVAVTFSLKGFHPFLAVSALLLAVVATVIWRYVEWTVLVASVGALLVVLGIYEMIWGLVAAAIVVTVMGLFFKFSGWRTALMILAVSVLGFSIHLFIPIRSAQHPSINENNPSQSFAATVSYLERKQYGSESMMERMFTRRAEWTNQFGVHARMGFWGFFQNQYGINGTRFIIPFLIAIFGLWEIIRRRPRFGLPLLVLILICTVGLILYMNFADGTRQDVNPRDYLEVRDRDYFFTQGFVYFGLAIGLGITALIQSLRDALKKSSSGLQKIAIYASLVLFLSPVYALANNYYYADRSNNYMPFDYARNLLESCDQDAVMFTSGDNDTFPVWALQEVYKIRTDVKNVNLSLANTNWYVKQVQDYMGVQLGWTDEQIDRLQTFRDQNGRIHTLASQVVDAVIANNLGRRPINFSVTSGGGVRRFRGQSIDTLVELNGMMWRVTEEPRGLRVSLPEAYDFFMNEFTARNLNDPSVYKDETARRLTGNYMNGILMVCDTLYRAGDVDRSEKLIRRAIALMPEADNAVNFYASLLERTDRLDDLAALIDTTVSGDRLLMRTYLARGYRADSNYTAAMRVLEELLAENPHYSPAFGELIRYYISRGDIFELRNRLIDWLADNPDDQEAANLLRQIEAAADSAAANREGGR